MKTYNTKKEARQALRDFNKEFKKLKKKYQVNVETESSYYPIFHIARYSAGDEEHIELDVF